MNDECAKTLLPLLGGRGRGEGGIVVRGSWKEFCLSTSAAARFVCLLYLCPLVCQGTAPELMDIVPTGAQRGSELEVSFIGTRLQDAEEILCYEPGIRILSLNLVTNNVVKGRLRIEPDCDLGEHRLRVRTATGISELRTFVVGPFPVVEEVEPNNEPAKAQPVALNTTVSGVIKNEDVDCFAVEMKSGQRLSAEVEGIRLGRTLFDPRLSILDASGTVLSDVDDTWLAMQDPFISLVAPKDGTYIVRLREATYGGNDACHYRLHIGTFPRPTAVFPLGGRVGELLDLKFFSEATGEFVQQVKLPSTLQTKFAVFAELDGLTAPTPNWIRVSDFGNVFATPSSHDREHATVVEQAPPFALNGILLTNRQEDWFQFPAVKDQKLEVGVFARRLRSPLDSEVEIFDGNGRQIASNDDGAGADSELKFTVPGTTNYFLRIYDKLGRGGHDFTYRVEITPVSASVAVKIPEVARNDTQSRQFIAIPRGNRCATLISAKRANFASELVFQASALPAGVSFVADTMAKNVEQMPLVFEAAPDAPLSARLLDLSATGTNVTEQIRGEFSQNVEWVQGPPNNASYYATSVDKLCVAVTKEAPFHLRVVEPKVPLVQAGSMSLEVIAERAPGFDEPIEVQMVWNPPGVSSESEATIPKGGTNVSYQLNATAGAETRAWKIVLLGHANVEGGPVYVSSQLAGLEVSTPFLLGKIETLWLSPGKSAKLTVNLQQKKEFEGKATIRLCGLPEKVSCPEREITKDDQEVEFDVTADPACPPGSFKNLFCDVEVKQQGEVIRHNIAQGGILRVVPPKKAETKVAAAEKK
jgi:hypothetical protein